MEGRPSPQHHMQQPQQQQQGQHLAIMEGRPSPQHHMQQPQQQQQQQQHPRQKHTSPNVTPPLRPGGGNGMGSNQNAGYNTSPSSIFPPNVGPGFPGAQQMSRSYSGGEGSPNRFPMPGSPHGMGPPSQHVSSSTHPNMGNQKRK